MPDWVIALGALLLGVAVLWPFLRGASTKSTIELLRSELQVEREARAAQEVRCAADVAELRGQLHAATETFARVIAKEVVAAIEQNGKSGG